jgi:hypothetical protein
MSLHFRQTEEWLLEERTWDPDEHPRDEKGEFATGDAKVETDKTGMYTKGGADLKYTNYTGTTGNNQHITRSEMGTVPTRAIANMRGAATERPGDGPNRGPTGQHWEEFKQSIAENGIRSPIFITVDHGGQPRISEGNHRRDAAVSLGMENVPVEIRYFGHAEDEGTVMDRYWHLWAGRQTQEWLLEEREWNPDLHPKDDKGRWATTAGSAIQLKPDTTVGVGADHYTLEAMTGNAIENKGLENSVNAGNYNPGPVVDWHNDDSIVASDEVASACKAAVSADIAKRMGTKYDEQLLGITRMEGEHTYDDKGMLTGYKNLDVPTASLLTKDDVWQPGRSPWTDQPIYAYVGKLDYLTKNGSGITQSALASGDLKLGNDPAVADTLRLEAVSNLIGTWAGTSNDSSATSLAMQEAAKQEFGLIDTTGWLGNTGLIQGLPDSDLATRTQKEYDAKGDMYRGFLRAQYDNTQEYLKSEGITDVQVYRGFKFDGAESPSTVLPEWVDNHYGYVPNPNPRTDDEVLKPAGPETVPLRPLSAFSYSMRTARSFSGGNGVIISGTVPASQVLSSAVTGMGCFGERELVLLGGSQRWSVMQT